MLVEWITISTYYYFRPFGAIGHYCPCSAIVGPKPQVYVHVSVLWLLLWHNPFIISFYNSPCHGYLNSYTLSQRVILGVAVKGLLLTNNENLRTENEHPLSKCNWCFVSKTEVICISRKSVYVNPLSVLHMCFLYFQYLIADKEPWTRVLGKVLFL